MPIEHRLEAYAMLSLIFRTVEDLSEPSLCSVKAIPTDKPHRSRRFAPLEGNTPFSRLR